MKKTEFIFAILLILINSLRSMAGFDASDSALSVTSVSPGYSPLEDNYDVSFYFIDLEATDQSTFIKGSATVCASRVADNIDNFVLELNDVYLVDSVFLQDIRIDGFTRGSGLVSVPVPLSRRQDNEFKVKIYYKGQMTGSGFFRGISNNLSLNYQTRVTYTLSEPFQASEWYPVKQNLKDKADSAWIFITVDSTLRAGSNGLLTNITAMPDGKKRYEWKSRHPIAYYLISMAVADYREYNFYVRIGNDSVFVQNYLYDHPSLPGSVKADIDQTAGLLSVFSEKFGIYPYYKEKYGHCMAPLGGGMENQTMTTLNSFRFGLVAHELAHSWFGNYVTCATWQDIWINEGFATYSEYIALEEMVSEKEAISFMKDNNSSASNYPYEGIYLTPEEAKDELRIFNVNLSYDKGGSILHMLRFELDNDELFFRILRKYLARFADSIATGSDFMQIAEDESNLDLDWFFEQWYYGKGHPVFTGTWKQTGETVSLKLNQLGTSPRTPFFRTHLEFRLLFEDGRDTTLRVLYDQPSETFDIRIIGKVKSVLIDPDEHVLETAVIEKEFPGGIIFVLNPNPFIDSVNIKFRDDHIERRVTVTGLNGRIFYDNRSTSKSLLMDLSYLRSGLYLLSVEEKGVKVTEKIIKQ